MGTTGIDLLVVAELNPDVVIATDAPVRFGQVEQLVDGARLTLGSSGAITASAAAAQGVRVALCATVGDDVLGSVTLDLLRARGVIADSVVTLPGRNTGMTIVLSRSDGDRALLTYSGTMAELTTHHVRPQTLRSARHLHVSSIFLQDALRPGLTQLLRDARAAGLTTSVDPGWDPAESWTAALPLLGYLDHFLPNAAEACAIASVLEGVRIDDVAAAARLLAAAGPTVVVKNGADGAVGCRGGEVFVAQGAPVAQADLVDTTGAGDNFDASYLAAVLEDAELPEALARGFVGGAISLGGFGGTARHASRAECLDGAAHVSVRTLPPVSPSPRSDPARTKEKS